MPQSLRKPSKRSASLAHECFDCKLTFQTPLTLKLHRQSCFLRYCNICKSLIEADKFRNHLLFHQLKKKIDKEISEHPKLKMKPKLTGAFKCNLCQKNFSRKDALKAHKICRHTDKTLRVHYPCDVCGQMFLDKTRVDTHIKRTHLKDFKYYCSKCNKGFLYLGELNKHVKVVHEKTETTFIACTYENCNKVFKTPSSLKYHLHHHEENKPTFICDQCGKIFNHPLLYKKHLRKHGGERKVYTCQVCDKTIASMGSLEDHMRLHSGEKPYICEHCGRGFRTRVILSAHLVVHTKEKNHICKFCGKAFTQRSPLKAHLVKCHPDRLENENV